MIVEELEGERDVADEHTERRRHTAYRHLDRHGRGYGMHAAANAAGPARDEDGVARVAADHDDLVATEQGRHGACLQHLAALEVGDGVEGQCPCHAGDRVEVEVLDVAVALEQLLDPLRRQLSGRSARGSLGGAIWIGDPSAEKRLALRVELDGKVLKAHGVLVLSLEPKYPGRPPDMAISRLETTQQRAERTVDGGELFGERRRVASHRFEPISDGGDALLRTEERPGNGDEVAGEYDDHESHGDQGQDQQHGKLLIVRAPPARRRPYRASGRQIRRLRASPRLRRWWRRARL